MKNGSTRVGISLCLARRRRPTRRAIPIGKILEESKFTLIGIKAEGIKSELVPDSIGERGGIVMDREAHRKAVREGRRLFSYNPLQLRCVKCGKN